MLMKDKTVVVIGGSLESLARAQGVEAWIWKMAPSFVTLPKCLGENFQVIRRGIVQAPGDA